MRISCDTHICTVAKNAMSLVSNERRLTDNSRTNRHRVIKLGGRVGHMTRHVWQLFKVKRSNQTSRSQDHVTYHQTEHFNSAVNDRINLKLGGNYCHGGRCVWYTF